MASHQSVASTRAARVIAKADVISITAQAALDRSIEIQRAALRETIETRERLRRETADLRGVVA